MASFFPLAQTCTIQVNTMAADISGQLADVWATSLAGVPCLWYQTSGSRQSKELTEYSQTAELYLQPGTAVEEGNRIINITNMDGSIQDAGPYEVDLVRKVPTLGGQAHHISLRLKGVS